MARAPQDVTDIRALVENFAAQLIGAVETTVNQRIQQAISMALEGGAARRPGRPPKNGLVRAGLLSLDPPRRRPKQLCPVPGCTNLAAPVFGMVCSAHKDVSKTKIREYREARRKAKAHGDDKEDARKN